MIRKKLKLIFFGDENFSFKESFIEFITNPREIISFFVPIIIALVLIIPVPYTVTVGGGTINIDKKIDVDNEYNSDGSFNSAYVKELKGRVITYLMAKIIPSYELNKLEEVTLENESEEDYTYREKTYFTSSLDDAMYVAYKKANKKIDIKEEKIYVIYILNEAETNLEVSDQILEVDGNKINNVDDITNIINMYDYEEEVIVKVLRNKKEIECYFKIKNINNEKKIGVYLNKKYIYETEPQIEFDFTSRESGPSGGLMITLSIYNKLVDEDITKGLKIVGTGTIDRDGNVGEIGGVKEKLKAAVNKKADIFIVPEGNYEKAKQVKEENDYNIKLIKVKTFEETLEKLKNIK